MTVCGMIPFEFYSQSWQWLFVRWHPLRFTVHHYNNWCWDVILWDFQYIISMTVGGMIPLDIYCPSLQWLLLGSHSLRFTGHHINDCLWDDILWYLLFIITVTVGWVIQICSPSLLVHLWYWKSTNHNVTFLV